MGSHKSVVFELFFERSEVPGGFEILTGAVDDDSPVEDFQEENIGDIYQFRYAIPPNWYLDWDIFTVDLLYCFQESQIMGKGGATFIDFHFQEKLEKIVQGFAALFLKAKYNVIGHCWSPFIRFVYNNIETSLHSIGNHCIIGTECG